MSNTHRPSHPKQAGAIWTLTSAANDLEDINKKLEDIADVLDYADDPSLSDAYGEVARITRKIRAETSRDIAQMARLLHKMRPKVRDHRRAAQSGRGMTTAASDTKLDPATKARIAREFDRVGLDGNGRFLKAEHGFSTALDILANFGIEMDEVPNSHLFRRPDGRLTLDLAWTNDADPFSPSSIPNSVLVLTWHKFEETGKFECLAYLS